jgi:hypothetical protein
MGRRRQARQNQNQLAPKQRPYYRKVDAESSKRKLQRLIETERRIKSKGGVK